MHSANYRHTASFVLHKYVSRQVLSCALLVNEQSQRQYTHDGTYGSFTYTSFVLMLGVHSPERNRRCVFEEIPITIHSSSQMHLTRHVLHVPFLTIHHRYITYFSCSYAMNVTATINVQDKGVCHFNTEKEKRTEKSHSLALALTLTLTVTLSPNHSATSDC